VTWEDLFEQAAAHRATEADIREALARRRAAREGDHGGGDDRGDDVGKTEGGPNSGGETDPMVRIVADADVLAADLLVGGASREAVTLFRAHDWLSLLASEPLIADAEAVIADLAHDGLAAAWRERIADLVTPVEHPAGDHPALASAMRGDARHVLSLDPDLASVGAGVAIRREAGVETSVRPPEAFVRLFDPASVHEAVFGKPYPGPDRE
jgi:hypothetical protein